MAHRTLQRVRVRAVLHRQICTDFGNVHIGHDAAHRELLGIRQGRGGCPSLSDSYAGQHGVILLCRFTLGGQLCIVSIFDSCSVVSFHIGMTLVIDNYAGPWIEQKSSCNKEQYTR